MILVLSIKGYGQTYTAKVAYDIPGNTSYRYTYSYDFGGQSGPGISGAGVQYEIFPNVAHLDVYTLKTRGVCGPSRADDICSEQTTETIQNLIIDPRNLSWGCMCVSSEIIEFTPNNLTISNKKPNIVCSGDQLELEVSSPNVFPVEAYHWQYSLDNKLTWIDVPSSIGTNLKTNNTPLTTFSINDLLGSTSEQYFNTTIYFRLGYDDDRPFSNVIPITFSPCAPVIESIAFEGPKCSGDIVQKIEVTFDRDLKLNESIFPLYILDTDTSITTPLCAQINPVTSLVRDPISNKYKYTFIQLNRLISGHTYVVKYQAFLNATPMGVIQTTAPSPYNEIAPITFDVTKTNNTKTNILCKGKNTGSITVEDAKGGNGGYSYSNDGGTSWQTSPTFPNLKAGIYSVKIKDKLQTPCTSVAVDIVLSEPNNAIEVDGTPDISNSTGFGKSNGSISIAFKNGTGTYTYTWTKDPSNPAPSNPTPLTPEPDWDKLGAGYYTITANSGGCSSEPYAFTITQPNQLEVSITGNAILCNGNSTGALSVVETKGGTVTIGYNYEWFKKDGSGNFYTTGATGATGASGIFAGVYKVKVSDNALPVNVAWSNEFEIIQPTTPLNASTSQTNITCNGANNGEITVNITGGTTGYSILWNDGITIPGRIGLSVGSYSYTVTDANNCQYNSPGNITITQPSLPTVNSINQTQPSSLIAQDGSITITATEGTGSYTYIIKKGNVITNYTSNSITNLENGTYEVWVKDANNCESTPKTIKLEALNVSLIASNNILCHSDATGNITVSASGGTLITNTNYKLKWFKNGFELIGQTNPTINGLTFGDYYVQITDDKTTIQSPTYTLTQPPFPLSVTSSPAQQHNQTCSDIQDGAIEITVSGGTAGYTYAWSNTKTTKDISGLSAGTYSVTVTDANSCPETLSGIILTPISPITFPTETITKVSIFGQSTGAITFALDPTGGNTGGYTYSWTSTVPTFIPKTSKDISDLKAGLYTLEIKDSKGCTTIPKIFEVTQEPELSVTIIESSPIKCNGDFNGELQAIVTGGVATYNYQWFKNGEKYGTNSDTQSGLGFGDYIVEVTDSKGAVKTSLVPPLSQPTLLSVTASQTNVLCHGAETGAINITINGGTAPYTQQWTKDKIDYLKDEDLINLGAGTYQVTVTDAVGHNCTATLSEPITINQPDAALAINNLDIKNLTGFETLNGSIKVAITGGKSPYKFSFGIQSNVAIVGSELLLDKLPMGSYTLTISDANGCTTFKDYTLLQPEELKINSVTQTALITCNGDKTATLQATVSGGRPIGILDADKSYIYNWYKTTDLINPVATSNPATGLGVGTYRLIVTDGTDSFKNTTTSNDIIITEPAPIALTFTKTDATCKGESDGTIQINTTGGSGNYTIIWSYNPATNNNKTSIFGLSKGDYNVRIIDKNDINCFKDFTISIDEPADALAFNPATIVNASGFELSNGSITLDITGGRPTYSYKWYNGSVVDSAKLISNATKTISNLTAGFYTALVEDTNPFGTNCTITKTFEIKQPEELTLTVVPTIAYCNNGLGSLLATASGGTEIEQLQSERVYTYSLLDNTDKVLQILYGNTANFIALPSGDYKVIVIDSKNNQTAPFLINLGQPTPIVVTLSAKPNVTCFNGNDGSISINVTGGTPIIENGFPVYTYEWKKDGIVINMNNNLSPSSLKSGNYSVKVFDGNYNSNDPNFCIGSLENINITQPADFGFDLDKIVPTIPTAKNAFDGALHIEIVGGIAPYTYVCKDSKNTIIETKAGIPNKQADFLSLTTDNYTVSVTDATGCTKSTAFDFNNNVLTITTTQNTPVTCNNGTDATLNAAVIGGFGVKTISWYKNNVLIPNETAATLTNNSIGSYYAVVKDFNKVEVSSNTIIVTQPNAISASSTQKEISCKGFNDGSITLSANGGSNIFQYRFRITGNPYSSWIPFEKTTTATLSNLKAGVYTIQIQDNKGCNYTSNLDITLSEPALLNISKSTITSTTGFNVANGSISITAQGGNGGYLYKWFNSANTQLNQTTATLTNVLAGKYYVIITDNKGCQFTSSLFEITQPDKLLVSLSLFNAILCNGDKNASLKTTTTGGIAGYTYQWFNINSPNKIGTGTTLPTIGAGTYYVIVTDSKNNITKSDSFIVTEPAILNNTLSSEYTRCGDAKDWTITTAPVGGTVPYTYLWNTGEKTATLLDVIPGTYSVLVTDNNGCSITKNSTITAPVHLATAETITKPTCFEGSDATIVLTSSGGQGPYTYLWNTGEKSNTLSNASAKVYSVAVTDFKGCVIDKTYTIENPPKDVITLGEDVTLCFDQSLTINSTIADDKAKYAWTSTKGFKSDKPIITVSEPAEYTLVVTNRLGCTATDMLKISKQETAISAEFAVSSQVFVNEKFIMVDISNPIADGIEWSLPAEATVVSKNKDYAELSFSKAGEYELTLNTKKGNCTATQTKKIVVIEGEYVNPESTDLKKKFDLKIYPNPSSGIFTVDVTLDKEMSAHVKVYNLTNNVVIDSKHQEGKDAYKFDFSLSGLTSGVYFVLVESQQGNQLRKIIIK